MNVLPSFQQMTEPSEERDAFEVADAGPVMGERLRQRISTLTPEQIGDLLEECEQQLRRDRQVLAAEKEERQALRRKRKYRRHHYFYAMDKDDSGTNVMSMVSMAMQYIQSSLFIWVLSHVMLYFAVQLLFVGFFVMFPDLGAYFQDLSFGEASFLVSFVIGSVFGNQMANLDQSFKDQPRSAHGIFNSITELSDDVSSMAEVEALPLDARVRLIIMLRCLRDLSTQVLRSFYAAEGHKRRMGEETIARVRDEFGTFRINYCTAKTTCVKAGIPGVLPEFIDRKANDVRDLWVGNTLFHINFRGHEIALWHVNFFVGVYLYCILPAQMYGALGLFSLVLYTLVMIIFNVQGVVYTFLGNPFDSRNQTRLQADDFVKLERSRRIHITQRLVEAIYAHQDFAAVGSYHQRLVHEK